MLVNDLNNKHMGTKSQKLRRITPIKNYIVDKIDNNQNIKRLSRYMTTTPLMNKGKTLDGKIVVQNDLNDSLCGVSTNDKNVQIKDRILFNCAFTDDVLEERRLNIYVHCPRSTFNPNKANNNMYRGTDEYTGTHVFYVEIVYPIEYESISPNSGHERSMEIACEILDMFDDMYIDNELQQEIGSVSFCITGEVLNQRLVKSGYMILSIPITASVFTRRIGAHKLDK